MATTTVSYGSITLTQLQDGSQFWTSTTEPISPDYTFTISNLVGDTNADIKVGDIIYQSHYRYTVTTVNNDGLTVLCGNRENLRGADGISPTVKSIVCSHSAVVCEKDGSYNPDSIIFSGQAQTEDVISAYQGWFIIELSSDAETWVTSYTSASKESSIDYKIPLGVNTTKDGILYHQGSTITTNGSVVNSNFVITSDGVITSTQDIGFIIRSIRCSLYSDANKTNLIDQQRVNIAFDGVDGDKGDDGYTVILTNENHTFAGNSRTAIASFTESDVISYIGGVQTTCTIGTITGCPNGMTTEIFNNDTTIAKFRVSVTSAMTSQNGVLNIPVIVNDGTTNGKLFNMKFTYSLKLNGLDATGLGWMVNYSSLTTPNNGECYYHGFDDATKEPTDAKDGWVMWNGQEIIIPHGCFINPDNTMPYNSTIYSVYRLPNATTYTGGIFHDIAWDDTTNSWKSNTYTGTTPTTDTNSWVWNEDTDIILAMYVEPSDEGAITNAQLFVPPKKYSELVEPAKTTATNYLSGDSTGIMVADMNDGRQTPSTATGNNVFINNTSVNIRSGQNTLASFGSSGIQIGTTSTSVNIDRDSFDLKRNSNEYVHLGYGEGNAQSGTAVAPYYSIGTRKANSAVGNYSIAEGYTNEASGFASHAEGHDTTASGLMSHAEGYDNISSGGYSHTEGERNTASGTVSHAGGYNCAVSGNGSFAHGYGLLASGDTQAVFGRYNIEDTSHEYAMIIGNGTINENQERVHSNLLTVGWDGRIKSADGFDSGMPPFKWKSASYTASNLASGHTDVTTDVSFPNLAGYSKTIMVVGTNSAYTGATGAYVDNNDIVHIRCRNFNTAASSPTISFVLIYLNNTCTWT